MRALITGVAGFAGSHLADYLVTHTDYEVWGVVRRTRWRVAHLQDRIHLVTCDLTNQVATSRMIDNVRPDLVFHLAADARVGASWHHPWQTYEANLRAQLSLLEALVTTKQQAHVLIVGSNEAYGKPVRLPVDEDHPFRPVTPYGVSKAAQDLMGLQYHLAFDLPVVRVRPFNHIGPRQSQGFVCADFASQVARIEAGLQEPVIRVGNLSARRDFTDVRDVARAYHLALTQGHVGDVYNVGSGEAHAIQEILDILLRASRVPIRVEVDPKRLRPSDVPEVRCDAGKLRSHTGWEPTIPFETSVLDTLEDWRRRVRETSNE
ncbi:MAG: GDP-mannose 4,6-dehydratase [Chloroflexi bacterium]|nr:GDP-mannose 4,6-dehydratase [Chloroflexota bacterium]